MATEKIEYLPIERIVTQQQVREKFDGSAHLEMVETLVKVGQLQPIRVQAAPPDFIVVDGERRVRAVRTLGWKCIAAIVESTKLSESDVVQRQLIANIQREDLSPLEKAKAISRLMALANCPASEASSKLGLTPSTTTRLLSLLSLPDELQQQVSSGEITPSAAYELAKIEDPVLQSQFAKELASGAMTRDRLAGARKAARKPQDVKPMTAPGRFMAVLGTGRTVTVAGNGLDLESFISTLEEILSRARKARSTGIALPTFMKLLRDQAEAA